MGLTMTKYGCGGTFWNRGVWRQWVLSLIAVFSVVGRSKAHRYLHRKALTFVNHASPVCSIHASHVKH